MSRSAKVSISGAQILLVKLEWYLERNTFLAKYRYLECGSFFEDFPNHCLHGTYYTHYTQDFL